MSRQILPALFLSLTLSACASGGGSVGGWFNSPSTPAAPPPTASAPPAPGISPEDIVGRWGFASYHRDTDRTRTTNNARGQCSNAYAINRGPNGGVLMHLPDTAQPVELRTKAGADGKRYLGPDGPAPDSQDREIVDFDGRIMVLRWVDQEVAGRYGTSVYVRCTPRVAAPRGGAPKR
jgi:hypothetical protein